MKRMFASSIFVILFLSFVQPMANATTVNNYQGSGCPYVCKQELKRCRKGKKACRQQYVRCMKECPR